MNELKYVDTAITFSEIPDEITLCINISNCPFRCTGCHSPYLQKDKGKLLTKDEIDSLISKNNGITCVCLMGGDANVYELIRLMRHIKLTYQNLKLGWYSGADQSYHNYYTEGMTHAYLDYVKYGPYDLEQGPLDDPNTNQRFYKITWDGGVAQMECMNSWFQNKHNEITKTA